MEVGFVAADEGEGKEANGDNGAKVDAAVHVGIVSGAKEGGCAGENLGHYCCEEHVPCW